MRGTTGFWDRRVVRDVLAYLRAVANPLDSLSLAHIVNLPARGLGGVAWGRFVANAGQHGLAPGQALADPRCSDGLKPAPAAALRAFGAQMESWRRSASRGIPPATIIPAVLRDSGYERWVSSALPEAERPDALGHLRELAESAGEHTTLSSFLQHVALMTAVDGKDDGRDAVQLLTIHAAKGLEWPIVFVVGLEEGTLPHERSLGDAAGVEEERRLCYVAITRAREQLWLSWANSRQRGVMARRSRFVDEIVAYGKERAG